MITVRADFIRNVNDWIESECRDIPLDLLEVRINPSEENSVELYDIESGGYLSRRSLSYFTD